MTSTAMGSRAIQTSSSRIRHIATTNSAMEAFATANGKPAAMDRPSSVRVRVPSTMRMMAQTMTMPTILPSSIAASAPA